jgi:hypothetical protein
MKEYWRQKPVILVRNPNVNKKAQRATELQTLKATAASAPLPLAGMESYAFRNEAQISLQEYLEQLTQSESNINVDAINASIPSFSFGTDVLEIGTKYYQVPTVLLELKDQLAEWSFQLAVAASGAGLAFHWHGDALAEVLHGQRRWFLASPERSPVFHPRRTTAQWIRDVYTPLYNTKEPNHTILECTLRPNEALYIPADWFHATLSLGQAVSITTSFAAAWRRDWQDTPNAKMLQALEQQDFSTALRQARAQQRPHHFPSQAWVGVILTLYAKTLTDEARLVQTLQEARIATTTCQKLNPLYPACHVWHYRQLQALARLLPNQSDQLLQEAAASQEQALKLGWDDELLDPKWQPKSMSRKQKA